MDSAICGFAPTEKSEPPACRCSFLEELEIDMELKKEALTEEQCGYCDAHGVSFVYLSSQRARLVAVEMLRLADEIEGK